MLNLFLFITIFLSITFVNANSQVESISTILKAKTEKPKVILLKTYKKGQHGDLRGWLMSEKLDGVRAIWNGFQLLSKGGKQIMAPKWFIDALPPFAIDGELWTKRNDFQGVASIVRDKIPNDKEWKEVGYYIFEVPPVKGVFDGGLLSRLKLLQKFLTQYKEQNEKISPIEIISQIVLDDESQLEKTLQEVLTLGGEGLVIRKAKLPYQVGRSSNVLKVKAYSDDECVIKSYLNGKGKFKGMVGAIKCQNSKGLMVTIGSGFTIAQRKNPPPIEAIITYKYYGLTKNGKARFPVFLRERHDFKLN